MMLLPPCCDGRGELLPVHQEVAVAGDREGDAPGREVGRDAGRHAVAHRAAGRRELRLVALHEPVVAEVAMHPAREVARAVGDGRVLRQMLLQQSDHGRHVDRAARRFRRQPGKGLRLEVGEIVRMGLRGPCLPRQLGRCAQHFEAARSRTHAGIDGQVGLVHPVEFFGARMDVHQRLFRLAALRAACSRRWSSRRVAGRSRGSGRSASRARPASD